MEIFAERQMCVTYGWLESPFFTCLTHVLAFLAPVAALRLSRFFYPAPMAHWMHCESFYEDLNDHFRTMSSDHFNNVYIHFRRIIKLNQPTYRSLFKHRLYYEALQKSKQ